MREIPLAYILTRYALVFIMTVVLISVITAVLEVFFGFNSVSGVAIVTALVPALDGGMAVVNKTGKGLDNRAKWLLSACMMGVNIALGFAVLGIATALGAPSIFTTVSNVPIWIIALVLLFIATVYLLATRFFFGMGIKQGEARLTTSP